MRLKVLVLVVDVAAVSFSQLVMDSARSIEFRFHMNLQKKLRDVVADVIRGER